MRRRCSRAMAGRDPRDSTSAEAPVPDYAALLDGKVKGLKLGLPREYLKDLTSETGDLIWRAVDELKKLGCEVREITLARHRVRDSVVLCDRDGGGEFQPGAL